MTKVAINPVSEADCLVFDAAVAHWQKVLNLSDWRIERSASRAKKNMAEVVFDAPARLATYRVGLSFGADKVTHRALMETALHESLHILLHDLINADPSAMESAEHRVINVLEKLLMKDLNAN